MNSFRWKLQKRGRSPGATAVDSPSISVTRDGSTGDSIDGPSDGPIVGAIEGPTPPPMLVHTLSPERLDNSGSSPARSSRSRRSAASISLSPTRGSKHSLSDRQQSTSSTTTTNSLSNKGLLLGMFSRSSYTRHFSKMSSSRAEAEAHLAIPGISSPLGNRPSRAQSDSSTVSVPTNRSSSERMGYDTDSSSAVNRSPSRASRGRSLVSLKKLKHKASTIGRSRKSEDSGKSASNSFSRSHSHTPSNATVYVQGQPQQTAGPTAPVAQTQAQAQAPRTLPFPMIRSQSSLVAGQVAGTQAMPHYEGPRRKTDSDASALFMRSPQSLGPANAGDPTELTAATLSNLALSPTPAHERESFELPPRGDLSPTEYAAMVLQQGYGGHVCTLLAKDGDEYSRAVMLAYASMFSFHGDPLDMALRKFLLYAHLPLETQQTERVLQVFSEVYHTQNAGLFTDVEQVYFVVFSMVILHTDTFNRNVRYKMTKPDYVRAAYCEGMPTEVFEYIFDNITYTQFIHAEDLAGPVAAHLHTIDEKKAADTHGADDGAAGSLGGLVTVGSTNNLMSLNTPALSARRASSFGWNRDSADPYTPILEGTLETLRPNLAQILSCEDPFETPLVNSVAEFHSIRNMFTTGPTIQLVSQRSRPEAHQVDIGEDRAEMDTESLLHITSPGVVTIKVVKIGILMRRESSKRVLSSRNHWREWGAILTQSQLYLFKNVAWVKGIMETAHGDGTIIRTTLDSFNATTVLSTKDMAAIKMREPEPQHHNWAFVMVNRGGNQMWFAAQDEWDMTSWMRAINYAAAFSTYHIGPAPQATPTQIFGSENGAQMQNGGDSSPTYKRSANSVLQRSVSDTSLAVPLSPQAPSLRVLAVAKQLAEIDRKIAAVEHQIHENERTTRHLRMLTPMQQKTREALVFAAGQYSSKCEWAWLDLARLKSYRNMLVLDKQLEEGPETGRLSVMTARSYGSANTDSESQYETPMASMATNDFASDDSEGDAAYLRRKEQHFEMNGHKFSVVKLNPDLARHNFGVSDDETSRAQN